MRRTTALALPVLVLAAGAAALAQPSGATSTSLPSFGVPRVVDPIHVYGEPNLEVNPRSGAVHATGPQGTGTQRSIWNVSVDGGDSYRIVQNLPGNSDRAALTGFLPTKSALGPGGGDTEIKIAHNGRAFFNDLAALVSFTAVTTGDDGATTSTANPAAIGTPGGDRQWMALYDPQPSDRTISPYKGVVPLNYMSSCLNSCGDCGRAYQEPGLSRAGTRKSRAPSGVLRVSVGVSISRNPRSCRTARAAWLTSERSFMAAAGPERRRSR